MQGDQMWRTDLFGPEELLDPKRTLTQSMLSRVKGSVRDVQGHQESL